MNSFLEAAVAVQCFEEYDLEVERLDAVAPDLLALVDAPEFFLKNDTQGFDLEALKGANGLMDRVLGL